MIKRVSGAPRGTEHPVDQRKAGPPGRPPATSSLRRPRPPS